MYPRADWCDGYASYYRLWARLERVVSPGCQRISGGESVNSVRGGAYQWVVMASQCTGPRPVPMLAGQDMLHWGITVLGYLHNIEMGSREPVTRKRHNGLTWAPIGQPSPVLASYWLLVRWSCRQCRYKCTAWPRWTDDTQCQSVECKMWGRVESGGHGVNIKLARDWKPWGEVLHETGRHIIISEIIPHFFEWLLQDKRPRTAW